MKGMQTDRQKQIIEAAIPLFLSEGVGVSTASIAKAAGVSNGTLFNAFATKQALIDAIYLTTSLDLLAAMPCTSQDDFTLDILHRNWSNYLRWAREKPQYRQIKHLLLEAGLTSQEVQADCNKASEQHVVWLQKALEAGAIRGPNVAFIHQLIQFQLSLVIEYDLNEEDEALAFEMICQAIGLSQ